MKSFAITTEAAAALAAMVAMFAGLLFLAAALDGDAWRYLPETIQ